MAILNGGTLAENVRFAEPTASNESVLRALEQAGIDRAVLRRLGSKGPDVTVRISDGVTPAELVLTPELELRIALARAFLQQPKVCAPTNESRKPSLSQSVRLYWSMTSSLL